MIFQNTEKTRKHLDENERGVTMIELLVAMMILSVIIVVSLSAVLNMTRSTVRSQAITDAADQLRVTFQRLDKEVRYAAAINMPAQVGNSIYVEYLVEHNAAEGIPECVQWRYQTDTGELQRRSWENGTVDASGWQTLVTDLRNDLSQSAQQPFTLQRAEVGADGRQYVHQRLAVYLDSGLGDAGDGRGGQLDADFVALNSSGRSQHTVCLSGGIGRS